MSQSKVPQMSLQINSDVSTKTLIPAPGGVGNPPDIKKLILANTSATTCLVTVSDGVNNYYFAVGGGATVKEDNLESDLTSTKWTVTCNTSVNSIYVTALYD